MTDKSRIFISYSHKDRERADFLYDGLIGLGHDVFIDREGIFAAENISDRIQEMIQGSDVVVLVLGSNWITSPACRQEMRLALEFNKRILPAAFENVGADLPSAISEINYVRFYGDDTSWDEGLANLNDAMGRDIAWIRDHTSYGEMANRWVRGQASTLWGRELRRMRSWIERQPAGAPQPTTEHWLYLKAGLRRRKWTQIVSTILTTLAVCASVVGGVFYISNSQCEELRSRAREAQTLEPILAIQNLLPLVSFSFCRADDAWLEILGELGTALQSQRLRASITLPDVPAHFVDFLPGSGHVVAATMDGTAEIFDPLTGALLAQEIEMPDVSIAPRILHDGGHFLLLRDNRATVWDPETGEVVGLPYAGPAPVLSAALAPERNALVVATAPDTLHFHSLISGRTLRAPIELGLHATAIAFVPGTARLIAAVGDEIRIIDLVPALDGQSFDLVRRLPMPDLVRSIHVSADGSTLAATTGTVAGVWDLTTLEPVLEPSELYRDGVEILSIGLSPDGLRLAVGASDKRARIHDVATGKILTTLQGHRSPVHSVRFSPHGDAVMTHDLAGVMRLFDVSTGLLVPTISDEMTQAVISTSQAGDAAADGRLEATGLTITIPPDQENILILEHELRETPLVYEDRLPHGRGFVTSMALSSDERLLVTAADDGNIRVWDAQTGLPLYVFSHARDALVTFVGADFTPEGDHIVSWDNNGEERVWHIRPMEGDLFQTACRLLPFRDGVRAISSADDDQPQIEAGDPCDDMGRVPHWGAAFGLTRG